ncbi:hypothetical protein CEXT_33451 [Caerostris extrusa]|uniref:Uncharacterized protein n=1 Tax=Caerostris extrusa TaxID=172846 RepID=A0AAV4URN8_CAEEX|nr:hypothetical protein CEXT_33451 [Caerostris extrusa]
MTYSTLAVPFVKDNHSSLQYYKLPMSNGLHLLVENASMCYHNCYSSDSSDFNTLHKHIINLCTLQNLCPPAIWLRKLPRVTNRGSGELHTVIETEVSWT